MALAAGDASLSKARVSLYTPLDDEPAFDVEAVAEAVAEAAEAAAARREEGDVGVHAKGNLFEDTDDCAVVAAVVGLSLTILRRGVLYTERFKELQVSRSLPPPLPLPLPLWFSSSSSSSPELKRLSSSLTLSNEMRCRAAPGVLLLAVDKVEFLPRWWLLMEEGRPRRCELPA